MYKYYSLFIPFDLCIPLSAVLLAFAAARGVCCHVISNSTSQISSVREVQDLKPYINPKQLCEMCRAGEADMVVRLRC